MTNPARMAGLLGIGVVLTMMGPFETNEHLRPLPRFAYWTAMVVMTYSAGYFANALAEKFAGRNASLVKRATLGAVLTTLCVFPLVYLLNGLALDFWATGRTLVLGFLNIAVIASIVAVVFHMIEDQQIRNGPAAQPAPIIDRIPLEKRGALVSISVEDHYVRIHTTKGEEMVLMRLGDAMREVGPTEGLQVHRSHWVAVDQVASARRKGDGAILTMSNGHDIPVSRANITKIKEAGLLPR